MGKIYFSDFFGVSPNKLYRYGAFDISLINDLPLFVDPFLLFNSRKKTYQKLHSEIIRYMRFLRDESLKPLITPHLIEAWFTFPEVKQNWLGFSRCMNKGHGLGHQFAQDLNRNLTTVFSDFGDETITRSSHLEKLCLIREGVGRDNISDFTTNLIRGYLADYTQKFARQCLQPSQRRTFKLEKIQFNYNTMSWMSSPFELPAWGNDYILLTPRDILTKDEAWINRSELLDHMGEIAQALPNHILRAEVNNYLFRVLPTGPKVTKAEIREAMSRVVEKYPQVLDYYIKGKEENGDNATSVALSRVQEVELWYINNVRKFVRESLEPGGFYRTAGDTYNEARERLLFLKDVVENKGGHKIFYRDGRPIQREADLQILFRLTWFATPMDVSREVNDGRGPADYKISRGAADKTIVEFKLANNAKLRQNLKKQTGVYEKASGTTRPSLKCILYFTESEYERIQKILDELGMLHDDNIILIDACSDNKLSGSKA